MPSVHVKGFALVGSPEDVRLLAGFSAWFSLSHDRRVVYRLDREKV